MQFVDLADHQQLINRVAEMLFEGFRQRWPDAWSDLDSATAEVEESLGEGRISLVAVAADVAIGWIGAIRAYPNAWELHPLVVAGSRRGEGIGRMLVEALQDRIAGRGGGTLYLGTDDQDGSTTVSGLISIRIRSGTSRGFRAITPSSSTENSDSPWSGSSPMPTDPVNRTSSWRNRSAMPRSWRSESVSVSTDG